MSGVPIATADDSQWWCVQVLSLVDEESTDASLPDKVYAYLSKAMAPHANKHVATRALFCKISLGFKPPRGTGVLDEAFVADSRLPPDKLKEFLRADIGTGKSSRLREGLIYGIGVASITKLKEEGIATVHQLLGHLLYDNSGNAFDPDRATTWLRSVGCSAAHTKAVVVQLFSRLAVSKGPVTVE